MENKPPIKNVDPVLVDIKSPQVNYAWSMKHGVINLRRATFSKLGGLQKLKFVGRIATMVALFLFFVFAAHTSYVLYQTKKEASVSGESIVRTFKDSIVSLQSLNSGAARTGFQKNINQIKSLETSMKESGTERILSMFGDVVPLFKDVGMLLQNTASLNMSFVSLADGVGTLQKNGFSYFQSDGAALIKTLQTIRDSIHTIIANAESIKNNTNRLKGFSVSAESMNNDIAEMYLSHSAEMYRAEAFLDGLIALLGSETERHILLMFQNPAEIRPGGGFLGSYADIGVAKGQMTSLDVRDIYDPDGQLAVKVVPPKEIQTLTEVWGARDANWFFDFSASAENVIWFLEHSKIYSEKNVTFDAAVALNTRVVESIVEVVGPIALPEYNLVISKDNFLVEVQREVEAGKDKKTNGQPKTILKKLAPILIERMKSLSEQEKEILVKTLGKHVAKKDIMVYAKDSSIQSFIREYNVAGAVHSVPNNFWGTYIAVVNTNIAGGKTDALIKQSVNATVHIDTSGSLLTDLEVVRAHGGGDKRDPWWNSENKNYIKILTNTGSSLVSISGNSVKKERSATNYGTGEYVYRDILQAVESSKVFLTDWNAWMFSEAGRTGFGAWVFTKPKETKTISVRYHTDNNTGTEIRSGTKYSFVFDKQSGVPTKLEVTVNAPIGFVWKETKTPVLTFSTEDVSAVELFGGELMRQGLSDN